MNMMNRTSDLAAGESAQAYSVQLGDILDSGDLSTNYKVAPGDVITVPERVL